MTRILFIFLIIVFLLLCVQLYPGGFYLALGNRTIHVHDLRATFLISLFVLFIYLYVVSKNDKKNILLENLSNRIESSLLIKKIFGSNIYMMLILFTSIILSYGGMLDNFFLPPDDFIWLYLADSVRSFKDILIIFHYFRPVVMGFDYIFYLIAGISPFGWYLTNIALHFANTLLVFWFANVIIKGKAWAFLVSLIFAVNYSHNEAVFVLFANVNMIVTLFSLCCLLSYLRFLNTKNIFIYIVSLFFFVLAIFSQEAGIVLPIIITLIYWLLTSSSYDKKISNYIKHILPYVFISGLYLFVQFTLFSKASLGGWTRLNTIGFHRKILERLEGFYYTFIFLFKESLAIPSVPLIFLFIVGIFIFKKYRRSINTKNFRISVFSLLCIIIWYMPYSFPNTFLPSVFKDSKYLYLSSVGSACFIGVFLKEVLYQVNKIEDRSYLYPVKITLWYFVLFSILINISSVNYQERFYYESFSRNFKKEVLGDKKVLTEIPYSDEYKVFTKNFLDCWNK